MDRRCVRGSECPDREERDSQSERDRCDLCPERIFRVLHFLGSRFRSTRARGQAWLIPEYVLPPIGRPLHRFFPVADWLRLGLWLGWRRRWFWSRRRCRATAIKSVHVIFDCRMSALDARIAFSDSPSCALSVMFSSLISRSRSTVTASPNPGRDHHRLISLK